MDSTTIIILVVVGIFALLLMGYVNNSIEKGKLEKARKKAELTERQQRLESLSEVLPAQFLSVALKQCLHKLELHFVEKLVENKSATTKNLARGEQLRERLAQGDSYKITNPKPVIHSEEQVKEARFQLESLQAQLTRAAEERLMPADKLKAYISHIQMQLVVLYLDYFKISGANLMQQGLPRQARLAYERAVKLLRRQTAPSLRERLAEFEHLLERTNAVVLEHGKKAAGENSELSEAVSSVEQEESWKKKQVYD